MSLMIREKTTSKNPLKYPDSPFQNPYSQVKSMRPLMGQALAREQQQAKAAQDAVALELIAEVERTLNPATGRARYNDSDGIINCIQMVDVLPWWRRMMVPFIGECCMIHRVKYLKVGQTNIYYRAQEWIAGREGKSFLEIIGNSKIPVINEPDLPKALSDG